MFIRKAQIQNFKGIKDRTYEFTKGEPLLISGHNGAGKTSFVQALRYGLTGDAPESPIRHGEEQAQVTLHIEDIEGMDPITIVRTIQRPNTNTVTVSGTEVRGKAKKTFMEEVLGITDKEAELVTSSELLSSLKPEALGELFLKHDKRSLTKKELREIFLKDKSKERDEINPKELSEDFVTMLDAFINTKNLNLEAIDRIADAAKEERRQDNALSKEYKARTYETHNPTRSLEELHSRLKELLSAEKNIQLLRSAKKAHDDAKKAADAQTAQLAELERKRASLGNVEKPDNGRVLKITEEIEENNKGIIEATSTKSTCEKTKTTLERTLSLLATNQCPLSEHLICHTDKTQIREELKRQVEEQDGAIRTMEGFIERDKKRIKELKAEKGEEEKKKERYDTYVNIARQIEFVRANPIIIPEDVTVPEGNSEEERKRIEEEIENWKRIRENEENKKKETYYLRQARIADYIYKACMDGGIVKEHFIMDSLEDLEVVCNERAYLFDKDLSLRFTYNKGLRVYFNFHGETLPYESLSKGERIAAILMIMDLLNCYLGSTVLILDELNDLDAENFEKLLRFISEPDIQEVYTNIILCCVDHENLLRIAEKYDVDILNI